MSDQDRAPLIVGIGGTVRAGSSSERTLAAALAAAEAAGARTRIFGGEMLARMPIYNPAEPGEHPERNDLVEAVREADGVIVCTPGYHGSLSGLLKNALDSLEPLSGDARPYFEGRAVGCIVVADGWQAGGTALSALRTIVHALRGWPTPLGLTLNPSAGKLFNEAGTFCDEGATRQVEMLAAQVIDFARAMRA